MKNQRILSAALAVLMAGSLAACGGGAAGSTPASDTTDTSSAASASQAAPVDEYKQYKGGDVVLATDSVFNNFFTPYQAGNAIAWGSFCMEPLGKKIQGTADDYDLVLAESFDVDEENFLVTIQVKQGIKFHDGTPLTAEDVAWTIQSWIDYGRGAQIGNPTEVRQTGDYTVEVQYPEFNVNYKTWLLPMQIFCKHTFDTIGLDAMMTSFNGTGPYVMDTYVEDYSLSFTRNEDYWQEHDWGPDTVTFLYTSDATSMAASVLNGDVDYMVMDAPETMELFEANGWELEVVQSDWDSLVPGVQTGTFDAVIAGQSMTAERSEQVDFAGPYYYASIVCVTKTDSPYANAAGISDLSGGTCTAQIAPIWYDSCLPQIEGAQVQTAAETAPAMLMALETDAVDFICTDMPTAMGAVAAYPDMKILDFTDSDDNFEVDEGEINIGISVMKGNTELKEAIDSVLSTMTADDFNTLMNEAIAIQPLSE